MTSIFVVATLVAVLCFPPALALSATGGHVTRTALSTHNTPGDPDTYSDVDVPDDDMGLPEAVLSDEAGLSLRFLPVLIGRNTLPITFQFIVALRL